MRVYVCVCVCVCVHVCDVCTCICISMYITLDHMCGGVWRQAEILIHSYA